MPKMKTKKAVHKRFIVSGSGKIKFHSTNRQHRAFGKTTKQKRHSRKPKMLAHANKRLIERCLPYRKSGGKK
ncbi:MAG: 50S ribosomal protein L35 [Mycoplasmataceae bacterium]|jgi:large subunit ribosomal protein L35|nr:50S ribosomal protein L35 [Mycoplasmataceae bacterium]